MKRPKMKRWLRVSLCILLACAITGIIVSVILFMKDRRRTSAQANLQLSFEGAADGRAPDGQPYNMDLMESDEVLGAALESAGLSGKYTVDELRENMVVTGNYPEDLLAKIMSYDSLMEFTSTHELTLSEYHPTLYSVTLCDDFDKSISAGELKDLLQKILENFRLKFAETYGATAKWVDDYSKLEDHDYPQQLEILQERIEQRARYAREMADQAPLFRYEGKGFNDINIAYNSLIDSRVMRVNSIISVYMPTKNPVRLLNQYNNSIDELKIELGMKEKELANLNELVSSYEKNDTIYLSNSESLSKIDGNSSQTYEVLVKKLKAVADEIADINTSIRGYETKIENLTGADAKNSAETANSVKNADAANSADPASTAESVSDASSEEFSLELSKQNVAETAAVEAEIADLEAQIEDIWNQFVGMLEAYTDQELNEQTVRDSKLRYNKPSLFSGAFVKKAIKTAGPFVAIGFIVCMMMLLLIVIREEKERNRLAEENR